MRKQTLNVTYGCLLHDIGKVVFRAESASGTHSSLGWSFMNDIPAYKDAVEINDCIKYHHAKEIRQGTPKNDNICYISYIADNISAAADRRETDDAVGFERYLPLSSVFCHMNGEHPGNVLTSVKPDRKPLIPSQNPQYRLTEGMYNEIVSDLKNQLMTLTPDEQWLNSLLCIYEALTGRIPSSTNTGESPDVSLYDHSKITAAVGACISEYLQDKGITDYKKTLFDNESSFIESDIEEVEFIPKMEEAI